MNNRKFLPTFSSKCINLSSVTQNYYAMVGEWRHHPPLEKQTVRQEHTQHWSWTVYSQWQGQRSKVKGFLIINGTGNWNNPPVFSTEDRSCCAERKRSCCTGLYFDLFLSSLVHLFCGNVVLVVVVILFIMFIVFFIILFWIRSVFAYFNYCFNPQVLVTKNKMARQKQRERVCVRLTAYTLLSRISFLSPVEGRLGSGLSGCLLTLSPSPLTCTPQRLPLRR